MEGQIDLFTLLSLIVAVVAVIKLRSVLGRKTGDEETRIDRRNQNAGPAPVADKVVSLPRRERETPAAEPQTVLSAADQEDKIKTASGGNASIADGLMAISKLDTDFDPQQFLNGARQAYEMIVTGFADGNRKMLRDLLSKEVYEGFAASISQREARGEQVDQKFVGIDKADILEAEVKNGVANVTIRFISELITATRNKSGAVINGDPGAIRKVTDIWTFSRDISNAAARRNPNWRLVETQDAH
jgi:predicted lipid-binding transport protein (Tim44 family)